jgi:hypothetical protein
MSRLRFALPAGPAAGPLGSFGEAETGSESREGGSASLATRNLAEDRWVAPTPSADPPYLFGSCKVPGRDNRVRARWVRSGKTNLGASVIFHKSLTFTLLRSVDPARLGPGAGRSRAECLTKSDNPMTRRRRVAAGGRSCDRPPGDGREAAPKSVTVRKTGEKPWKTRSLRASPVPEPGAHPRNPGSSRPAVHGVVRPPRLVSQETSNRANVIRS